ncbi:MAG: phage holin family protein [Pseudonocardiales bacterium]|nr:phage holin family protein [Pseudonocardiales bacterium]
MSPVSSVQTPTDSNGRPARDDALAAPVRVSSIPLTAERPPQFTEASVGGLVKEATIQLSTLIRSEVELAKAEVTSEVRKGVKGSVFFIVALTVLLFSLFFLFIALGEVLDIWLPRSAAFSIVFVLMVLIAALFGLLGFRRVRSIRKPERTITSVRETAQLASRRGKR